MINKKVQKAVQYAKELHEKHGVPMEQATDIALNILLERKPKQPPLATFKTKKQLS